MKELVEVDVLGVTGVYGAAIVAVVDVDCVVTLGATGLLIDTVVKLRSGGLVVVEGMATEVKKV